VTIEFDDPHCLASGAAEALLAGAPWRRLLVLGDSIAVHAGDPVPGFARRTWADRLAAALRPAAYRNLGVAGARCAEIRADQLAAAVDFDPDLAILAAGANDAMRRSFAPAAVERDLAAMAAALTRSGALLVTFGCFDLGRSAAVPAGERAALSIRLRTLGRLTESVTRHHGGVHVDFADHPAQSDGGGVLSADQIHIDARGHAVVAASLVRALAAGLHDPA
jgi:hypothetical protein